MIKRIKKIIASDDGSIMLEQVVLIAILVLIIGALLVFVFKIEDMGVAQSGYSTSTGWFRTENTMGMKN